MYKPRRHNRGRNFVRLANVMVYWLRGRAGIERYTRAVTLIRKRIATNLYAENLITKDFIWVYTNRASIVLANCQGKGLLVRESLRTMYCFPLTAIFALIIWTSVNSNRLILFYFLVKHIGWLKYDHRANYPILSLHNDIKEYLL